MTIKLFYHRLPTKHRSVISSFSFRLLSRELSPSHSTSELPTPLLPTEPQQLRTASTSWVNLASTSGPSSGFTLDLHRTGPLNSSGLTSGSTPSSWVQAVCAAADQVTVDTGHGAVLALVGDRLAGSASAWNWSTSASSLVKFSRFQLEPWSWSSTSLRLVLQSIGFPVWSQLNQLNWSFSLDFGQPSYLEQLTTTTSSDSFNFQTSSVFLTGYRLFA